MVYAAHLKCAVRKGLRVRVPLRAPAFLASLVEEKRSNDAALCLDVAADEFSTDRGEVVA